MLPRLEPTLCLKLLFYYYIILLTEAEDDAAGVVTELKTMPHILSTQTVGVPLWAKGNLVFVAQGIEIQSVMHATEPTTEPNAVTPPVKLNDAGVVFTAVFQRCKKGVYR